MSMKIVAPAKVVSEFPKIAWTPPTANCSLHGKSIKIFVAQLGPSETNHLLSLRVSSQYEWELRSSSGVGAYVALGFSADSKMGDDLVMACAAVSKDRLRSLGLVLTRTCLAEQQG